MNIQTFYDSLKKQYGPMGWWPVTEEVPGHGYHPGVFGIPQTRLGVFEVVLGAILTQNTAWSQVEKALQQLQQFQCLTPEAVLKVSEEDLAQWIRPAGYCHQKARYLKAVTLWFLQNESLRQQNQISVETVRKSLLAVHGVGPETADSILLYGFHALTFVIDTYTRRICEDLCFCAPRCSYESLRQAFMDALPPDVAIYQEYHALLVAHAKRYYSGKKAKKKATERPPCN